MHLCIDIGTHQVKCALFQEKKCVKIFKVRDLMELKSVIKDLSIEKGALACTDLQKSQEWTYQISSWGIEMKSIKCDDFLSRVVPEVKDLLLPDTIAKIYGALSLHPTNDCLVIDFGSTVRYELISKQGQLMGRTTFPFFDLLYRSLNAPNINFEDQPPLPFGLNLIDSIISGCFYGLLGSVERTVSEIRLHMPHPSELITIAVGTLSEVASWKNPLTELVDHIYPHLILEGLDKILNEGVKQ